jgi:hypothetical protein
MAFSLDRKQVQLCQATLSHKLSELGLDGYLVMMFGRYALILRDGKYAVVVPDGGPKYLRYDGGYKDISSAEDVSYFPRSGQLLALMRGGCQYDCSGAGDGHVEGVYRDGYKGT